MMNPGPSGASPMNDPLFKNWLKAAYGFNYLKSGLEGFVSTQVGQRYTTLRQQIFQQCPLVQPCSVCTSNNLLPDHGTSTSRCRKPNCFCSNRRCNRRKCPNSFCGLFYDLIVTDHTDSPRWSGVNLSAWYHDVYQYTKCFLTSPTQAVSITGLDCAGLLSIIINNSHIHQSISNVSLFKKCREDRNSIFHKGNYSVTDQEANDFIDGMISALEDTNTLIHDPTAKTCVTNLNKLKNDQITITDVDITGLIQNSVDEIKDLREKIKQDHRNEDKKRKQDFDQLLVNASQEIKRQKVEALDSIKQATNEGITVEDIRNRIVKIYEADYCSLPVSPLYDEDEEKVALLSIYQPPALYHVPYHRTQAKEKNQNENKYPLSSYKEIFRQDGQLMRKIYITGDAGVGKTSFCKRMSLLWCKSKSGERVDDEKVQDDIDFMSQFDFVFHVSLRETHMKDIVAIIVEQLFWCENDKKKDAIYATVEMILAQNKCVIIMDGLDEYSPREGGKININRLFSDKCTFITTCRPYKLETERLSVKDIDRHVQMKGINRKSTEHYVREIVNHINKASLKKKVPEGFMKDVKKCGLSTHIHIPIIASHLVAVWFNHTLTNMSRALVYGNIINMLLERAEKVKNMKSIISEDGLVQFPDSLSSLFYFSKHTALLKKICVLSYNLLFKQDKNLLDLVFTTEQLASKPYCVSVQEIDFFCKLGILSKNKVISRFGTREQKLSYVHETYLEFYAALFVSAFDSTHGFDNVVKNWNFVDDVLQYATFFRFFVGFSCEKSKAVFDAIYHSISDDLSLCRRNSVFHKDRALYLEKIKSLQSMVVHCFLETGQSNNPSIPLKLEDFVFDDDSSDDDNGDCSDDDNDGNSDGELSGFMDFLVDSYGKDLSEDDASSNDDDGTKTDDDGSRSDDDGTKSDDDGSSSDDDGSSSDDDGSSSDDDQDSSTLLALKELLSVNRTCVKSIYSSQGEYYKEFDQVQGLQYFCLGELDPIIEHIGITGDHEKFKQFMILNDSTLHTVKIRGDDSIISEIPLGSLPHLTSVCLDNFKLKHSDLRCVLNGLSTNVRIKDVELSNIYCAKHQRDFDSIDDIDDEYGDIGKESGMTDSSDNDTDIDADDDSGDSSDVDTDIDDDDDDDDDNSECMWTLDVSNHTQLTTLSLRKVNIVCNDVNTTCLKTVKLEPLSENIASQYMDVFESIKDTHLECLDVSGRRKFDLSDDSIKALTRMIKTLPFLKYLYLKQITLHHDDVLQLHSDVKQVQISLYDVTMSRQYFESLIENVVKNKSVRKFYLNNCKISSVDVDSDKKLSYSKSVKWIFKYLESKPSIKIIRKNFWSILFEFETSSCQ